MPPRMLYHQQHASDPLQHVQSDRFKESRRPKHVLFYPNGKPNYKPFPLRITPHKYHSFNDLLKDLTKSVKLPFGVRRVYTPVGGTEVDDLDDLEDGNTYLCASFERFKPASYGKGGSRPEWGPVGGHPPSKDVSHVYRNLGYTPQNVPTQGGARGAGFRQIYQRNDKAGARLKPLQTNDQQMHVFEAPIKRTIPKGTFGAAPRDKYAGSMGHLGTRAPPPAAGAHIAKKFRIVHDSNPNKGYDFQFHESSDDSLKAILAYVEQTVKHKMQRFFTLKNQEIRNLRELYRCPDDVLIATTRDQLTEATIKAVRDAIYNYKNMTTTSKNDSGFSDGMETPDGTPRVSQPPSVNRAIVVDKRGSPTRAVEEPEEDERPSDQQLSRVYQRKKERERKEREKLMQQELDKSNEERRKKRQQQRLDAEKKRRLNRQQHDTPAAEGEDKENRDLALAEKAENVRRRKEKGGAGTIRKRHNQLEPLESEKQDKEEKLLHAAESAEKKRARAKAEKEKELKRQREKERLREEEENNILRQGEQAEKERQKREQSVKKQDDYEFEEANHIRKKKKPKEENALQVSTDENDPGDAEVAERERQQILPPSKKPNFELEEADIVFRSNSAALREERERREAEAEAERIRKLREEEERLRAEEEAEKKRAEQEAKEEEERLEAERKKREEEEAEKARLAEEADKQRKKAALEEAARLRKLEEERQAAEAARKAAEEEQKRLEAEQEEERKREESAQRRKKEEEARKEQERIAAEEKRKADEAAAAAKAAEEKKKKEAEEAAAAAKKAAEKKPRAQGLILPIYEEEEIERKYELKRKMGDGNFANVYSAVLKSGTPPPGAPPEMTDFAVKQIDKSKVVGTRKNSSKVQMLKNEIDIMKTCDHPNIAKLYEAYETTKHVYLIMELVKGGDLFDCISENIKFDEAQSSLIIRHLAEALDYLHQRKIVHRDIKPENLLVEKDGKGRVTRVKLGDFGLAMHVKEKIYSVCGTPTYVAPEILAETGYGLEVDNWATGVISYILLCGFPPFRSIERNQDELFDTIQRGEFEYLSPYWDNISDTAKDLIDQLLVVEVRKRMKSKDVLKHKYLTMHNTSPQPSS